MYILVQLMFIFLSNKNVFLWFELVKIFHEVAISYAVHDVICTEMYDLEKGFTTTYL